MTFPLGRYGDSHVTPDELFDATDPAARPPLDAIDVQFRTPVTLNTLLHAMDETDNQSMLDDWCRLYREVAEGTRLSVQRSARGTDVGEPGTIEPVRCAISTVIHARVAGFAQPRWHLHVFVGATAVSVLDGQPLRVHLEDLSRAASGVAYPYYTNKLEELSNREWGLQWGYPDNWDLREIIRPDVADLVDSRDRGICTELGFNDVAQVIFPDQFDIDFAARSEAVTARARAEGRPRPGSYPPRR